MASVKYKIDRGRQERAICLVLTCMFNPCFKDETDKKLFVSLMKKIFEFEPTSFIEDLLGNILKEQINVDNLKVDNNQIQRVIFLNIFTIYNFHEDFCYGQVTNYFLF